MVPQHAERLYPCFYPMTSEIQITVKQNLIIAPRLTLFVKNLTRLNPCLRIMHMLDYVISKQSLIIEDPPGVTSSTWNAFPDYHCTEEETNYIFWSSQHFNTRWLVVTELKFRENYQELTLFTWSSAYNFKITTTPYSMKSKNDLSFYRYVTAKLAVYRSKTFSSSHKTIKIIVLENNCRFVFDLRFLPSWHYQQWY